MTAAKDTPRDGGRLAVNTLWMLIGQGAKLVIQAVYFVLIARNLGAEQYGAFVAVTAAAAIAAPFVGNGSGNLLVKNVARERQRLPEYLGMALVTTFTSGLILAGVVAAICVAALPSTIPLAVIVLVVVSDVLVFRFVDIACWAFQAVENLRWTAALNVFASLIRLGGLATIIVLGHPTVTAWAVAYLTTAGVASIVSIGLVIRRLGGPTFIAGHWRKEVREGFYFSTGLSAQTIYNDIDKTMLARSSTLDATGIYAAAYRIIDVAFVPIRALLAAAYPTFFRAGAKGIDGALENARRLIPRALMYSVVVTLGLLFAAPIVPYILGDEYARSTEALRWLALLPVLKTLHYFAADTLTGAGFQGLRTAIQIAVAVFNVLANLYVIPLYSWRGVAWTSLASDALLAMMLWSCALWISSRHKAPETSSSRST